MQKNVADKEYISRMNVNDKSFNLIVTNSLLFLMLTSCSKFGIKFVIIRGLRKSFTLNQYSLNPASI